VRSQRRKNRRQAVPPVDHRGKIGVTLAKETHAQRARQLNQVLRVASKKSSTPKRGTRQNQLIRTNHSRHACLVSTPIRDSSSTLRPSCLCALCVKFPFPTSLFIATFAQETGLVAQGAAPTLFSTRDLRLLAAKAHTSLHSQLPQNLHLHKNTGGWVRIANTLCCHHERRNGVPNARRRCAWWGGEREGSVFGLNVAPGFSPASGVSPSPSPGRQREIAFTGGTS
jgi:hypothetical protein